MHHFSPPRRASHIAVWDLKERKKRGVGWGERVSSKLLIKHESIRCHLSGHASNSPLREGGRESQDGGESIRRTEGRGKCLIHQSNYIMAIIERQPDIMGWTRWVYISGSFSRQWYAALSMFCPRPLRRGVHKSNTNAIHFSLKALFSIQ